MRVHAPFASAPTAARALQRAMISVVVRRAYDLYESAVSVALAGTCE